MVEIRTKIIIALVLSLFATGVSAAEITGTLGTSGSGSGTGSNGSTSGTVVGGAGSGSSSGGSSVSPDSSSQSYGSRSGQRRSIYATQSSASPALYSYPESAWSVDYGSYSRGSDRYLLSSDNSTLALLDPSLVAYERGVSDSKVTPNMAGVAGSGVPLSKAIVFSIVSLAIAGLASYAVNAYLVYRKERGL